MAGPQLQTPLDLCTIEGISFYCARGRHRKLHSHEWIELAYLEHGTLIHSVSGVNYKVNEGDYFIVEYGQPHEYIALNDGPISLMNIMFHPRFIDPTLVNARNLGEIFNHYLIHFNEKQLTATPTLTKFSDSSGNIHSCFKNIAQEIQERELGWRESVRGLLIHIIIQTLRSITSESCSSADMTISKQIIEFIHDNYMRSIKIGDAFGKGQYSTPYLSKRFKQETGVTFSEYLKHTRIDASRRLLINTDKPITEISELVGYVDTTFFHNTFRSIVGHTPTEYRKNRIAEKLTLTEYDENL